MTATPTPDKDGELRRLRQAIRGVPADGRGTLARTVGDWFEDQPEVIEAISTAVQALYADKPQTLPESDVEWAKQQPSEHPGYTRNDYLDAIMPSYGARPSSPQPAVADGDDELPRILAIGVPYMNPSWEKYPQDQEHMLKGFWNTKGFKDAEQAIRTKYISRETVAAALQDEPVDATYARKHHRNELRAELRREFGLEGEQTNG